MKDRRVIAVDGPSGVGKSSVSRELAHRLSWTYLDTGAMYRAVTLAWLKQDGEDHAFRHFQWLEQLDLDFNGDAVFLNEEDVSAAIRTPEVTRNVSMVSADASVRTFLTSMQRKIAARRPCILDGRDIGTVVFPDAFFKVFLTATAETRAHRRWLQQGGEDSEQSQAEIRDELIARDQYDSSRALAPLKKADDAFELATDNLDQEGVIDVLHREALRRLEA